MSIDIKETIERMGADALSASRHLADLSSDQKNKILLSMADQLLSDCDIIIEANKIDVSDTDVLIIPLKEIP